MSETRHARWWEESLTPDDRQRIMEGAGIGDEYAPFTDDPYWYELSAQHRQAILDSAQVR